MAVSLVRRVVLSLLAHPDDAEMFCAGTLIRHVDGSVMSPHVRVSSSVPRSAPSADAIRAATARSVD